MSNRVLVTHDLLCHISVCQENHAWADLENSVTKNARNGAKPYAMRIATRTSTLLGRLKLSECVSALVKKQSQRDTSLQNGANGTVSRLAPKKRDLLFGALFALSGIWEKLEKILVRTMRPTRRRLSSAINAFGRPIPLTEKNETSTIETAGRNSQALLKSTASRTFSGFGINKRVVASFVSNRSLKRVSTSIITHRWRVVAQMIGEIFGSCAKRAISRKTPATQLNSQRSMDCSFGDLALGAL